MTTLTEATSDELAAEVEKRRLEDEQPERLSYRNTVQGRIDADAKLTAAGVEAVIDERDVSWVEIDLPADAEGALPFWSAFKDTMIMAGGKVASSGNVRMQSVRAMQQLKKLSALLPDIEEE